MLVMKQTCDNFSAVRDPFDYCTFQFLTSYPTHGSVIKLNDGVNENDLTVHFYDYSIGPDTPEDENNVNVMFNTTIWIDPRYLHREFARVVGMVANRAIHAYPTNTDVWLYFPLSRGKASYDVSGYPKAQINVNQPITQSPYVGKVADPYSPNIVDNGLIDYGYNEFVGKFFIPFMIERNDVERKSIRTRSAIVKQVFAYGYATGASTLNVAVIDYSGRVVSQPIFSQTMGSSWFSNVEFYVPPLCSVDVTVGGTLNKSVTVGILVERVT